MERHIVANLDWLYASARQYCRNRYDADDLASDTIEKLLRHKEHYDPCRDFRPWAAMVMRNTFITQLNRHRCLPLLPLDDCQPTPSAYCADNRVGWSLAVSQVKRCARRSVAVECVVMYAKGYSYCEIAEQLGIPIGTVMSRVSNGRKLLRRALGECQ